MAQKYVPPSTELSAFNCPHCGVLTTQWWYNLGAQSRPSNNKLPRIWTHDQVDQLKQSRKSKEEISDQLIEKLHRLADGQPFLDGQGPNTHSDVNNIAVSKCMECSQLAIWIYDRLTWPVAVTAPDPNADLALDILADYREAATILPTSPRGAAALLRLCVQKLCKQLGETGDNINDDIASLVAKGLDVRVQMALDVVRVIGNESVHPGQIDLRDNRSTAEELFRLVNVVAEIMISQPKHIEEIYNGLPPDKRAAIEKRNQRSIAAPKPQADEVEE